jgi:divalent metal cation (Fe/Co/Zn/Cd) transporter
MDLGFLVAMIGIFLANQFNNPYFDGAASIVIGVLLAGVAVLLGYDTKGLLIGEGADRETLDDIRRLVESDPGLRALKLPVLALARRTLDPPARFCQAG